MKQCQYLSTVVLLLANSLTLHASETNDVTQTFRKNVQPIIAKYCLRCHSSEKPRGDLDLTKLDWDIVNGSDGETWHDILNRLNRGEMPPESAKQLSEHEHQTMVRLITTELKRFIVARRQSASKGVLRRLTRYEYNNTMRDLLGISIDFARDLPPDPSSPDGFKNNGATLSISPLQIEYYLKAARSAMSKVIVTGSRPEVHRAHATQSSKNRRKKQVVGNKLGPSHTFLMVAKKFPREGSVLVTVRAGAHVPKGKGVPRMRVSLGVRADTLAPMKPLGEVDVTASLDEPGTYQFTGRIEDFPLPGENPKFPGLLITVENVSADEQVTTGNKNKKKRKKGPIQLDPTQSYFEVKSVDFEGPVFDQWPPTHHARILFPSENAKNEDIYVREVLTRFISRAFRRPATRLEIDLHVQLFQKIRPRMDSFEEAIREVLAMVLISPDFLYLVEPRVVKEDKKKPLNDYELASRLSYFLWSTMPDEELLQLAQTNKLSDPKVLDKQIRRMIKDTKSWEFVRHFTNQWLDLSSLDRVAVNPEFYPSFDDRLKVDMRRETEHFFAEILQQDLSVLTLIDSDFAMLNRPLAKHYGINDGPLGSRFERVSLTADDKRGGLLTQGSILLGNSTGEHSHPIRRAVWLLDRLLDDPPAPPPPDVPDLNQNEPDLAKLSLRRQLEIHRKKTACMNCHRNIDPWGIAFENYDAVGQWRTEVKQKVAKKRKPQLTPVESETSLPNGKKLDGMTGLKDYLLKVKREQFARAVVVKVLTYALGRSLELADESTVDQLTAQFAKSGYRLSNLIVAIVQSERFRNK